MFTGTRLRTTAEQWGRQYAIEDNRVTIWAPNAVEGNRDTIQSKPILSDYV
jgi:hypothetical protein